MRLIVTAGVIGILAGCAAGTADNSVVQFSEPEPLSRQNETYYLKLELDNSVAFYGQPAPATTMNGAIGGPLYPANSAATFFAAIMTHAVIAKSLDEKRKNDAIDAANAILVPYQEAIDDIVPSSLLEYSIVQANERSDAKYAVAGAADMSDSGGWYTTIEPVYVMSHSEDALSVRANVSVYERRNGNDIADLKPIHSRVLHVQSAALTDPMSWLDDERKLFKETVHNLMHDVVSIAIDDFAGISPINERSVSTIRYLDNGAKTIERGRIIEENCQFILFESIRRELKRMQSLAKCD